MEKMARARPELVEKSQQQTPNSLEHTYIHSCLCLLCFVVAQQYKKKDS